MKKEKEERPVAYPKPTEVDKQLKDQNEFTERQSSRHSEEMVVNIPPQQQEDRTRKDSAS